MSRGTKAIIDFDNLRHNFKVLSKLAPSKLVLVVKADAYGHGLKQIVGALKNVDCFAVATIDEALIVRQARPNVRILLLEGYLNKQELESAFKYNFDSVIHQQYQLDLLDQIDTNLKMDIWLKYDSGMNRLGFSDVEYNQVLEKLEKHSKVAEVILMSHFASADDKTNEFTAQQTQKLLKHRNNQQTSLSNSSALLNKYYLPDEWCRVGLALFGVSPIETAFASDFNLKPVMTLKTNVIATKTVKSGESIGYSQTYRAKSDKKIAIIGIGYGDGYPWSLSESAYVMINNHKAKIIGRVSMDMMAIDISQAGTVSIRDSVLIWGNDSQQKLPIETVAHNANTIAYVLLCQITSRVHYKYVN